MTTYNNPDYNTDSDGVKRTGQIHISKTDYSFEEAVNYAKNFNAIIIVEPSHGNYWYIKGTNNNNTYEDFQQQLNNNNNKLKTGSKTWFIH
tara:strand:+ start:453 stop:725 length:273 start_codon:yes stop_codon:yes gene_type:complete